MMHRNQSVNVHQFAMIPRAEIPRSSFKLQRTLKTTFDSGYLVPIFCEEVLPGDTFNLRMTAFARLATPLYPVMDNLHLDSFFFFVPCRLVWDNWVKFMGEQKAPGDSISYVIPQLVSPVGGFLPNSVFDYFGLPTVGQVDAASTVSVNSLPLRAYNIIFNEWFRDENLGTPYGVLHDDGPDSLATFSLNRRGKRPDYFTTCLPWPQKGGTSVTIPLGTSAPVRANATDLVTGPGQSVRFRTNTGAFPGADAAAGFVTTDGTMVQGAPGGITGVVNGVYPANLYADLSQATAATINQLRQSFQIQKLLERDARGGTRYTEIIRSHFGVISPDARLQRPEYLGGGSSPITINPIAQTSATGVTGATTPIGTLSAVGTGLAQGHGFTQSFTEHGYIIGLVSVRADLTYQQGLRKLWSRSTRYDFYFPAFAMLGEQAVLNKEIYVKGLPSDNSVFGYQERWAEYRNLPSQVTGLFRSTTAGTLDGWHLAQHFNTLPVLSGNWILDNPPVERIVAVGAAANGAQFLMDTFFDITAARPLPMYSVPGLIDHF